MAGAERLGFESIKAELESGLTFARLAQSASSVGNRLGTKQARASARKAYGQARKHTLKAQLSEQEKQWLEGKLQELERALKQLSI